CLTELALRGQHRTHGAVGHHTVRRGSAGASQLQELLGDGPGHSVPSLRIIILKQPVLGRKGLLALSELLTEHQGSTKGLFRLWRRIAPGGQERRAQPYLQRQLLLPALRSRCPCL